MGDKGIWIPTSIKSILEAQIPKEWTNVRVVATQFLGNGGTITIAGQNNRGWACSKVLCYPSELPVQHH